MKAKFLFTAFFLCLSFAYSQVDEEEMTIFIPKKPTYWYIRETVSYINTHFPMSGRFITPSGKNVPIEKATTYGYGFGVNVERLLGNPKESKSSLLLYICYHHSGDMQQEFLTDSTSILVIKEGKETLVQGYNKAQTIINLQTISAEVLYRWNIGTTPLGMVAGVASSLRIGYLAEQYLELGATMPRPSEAPDGWSYKEPGSTTLVKNNTEHITPAAFYLATVVGVEYLIMLRRIAVIPSCKYSFGLTDAFPSTESTDRLSSYRLGIDIRFAL